MKVFKHLFYPDERKGMELDIIKFFTSDEASGIYLGYLDAKSNRWEKSPLTAVNYGPTGGIAQPVRGIQMERERNLAYLIDIEKRELRLEEANLLYDCDKILDRFVFEGTPGDIVNELLVNGFNKIFERMEIDTSQIDMNEILIQSELRSDLRRMDRLAHEKALELSNAYKLLVKPGFTYSEFMHRFEFYLQYGLSIKGVFTPVGDPVRYISECLPML